MTHFEYRLRQCPTSAEPLAGVLGDTEGTISKTHKTPYFCHVFFGIVILLGGLSLLDLPSSILGCRESGRKLNGAV